MVKGRDIKSNGALIIEEAHIITAEQLSLYVPLVRRVIAFGLWIFSLLGNIIAFIGGWNSVRLEVSWFLSLAFVGALLLSIAWQIFCTVVQFVMCSNKRDPIYICALIASVIPSFIGYQPLIALPITKWVTGIDLATAQGVPTPEVAVWVVLIHLLFIVILFAFDMLPEIIIVKKR